MKVVVTKDYEMMSKQVADHLINYINEKPASLIELPGGDTPLGIFKHLIEAANTNKVDLSQCSFVGLDEWGGLGYETKGSCIQTLFDCLYNHLPIDKEKQVCFFDGKADLKSECARIDKFIFDKGNIDIAVLGIGMNGHIGFNEPGVDENQYTTIVPLDDVTTSVSVKYFGKQLNIENGITLGMNHFFNAKQVILIADAAKKAEIVEQVVNGPITNEVPASLMRKVDNCTLYVDEAAASLLK